LVNDVKIHSYHLTTGNLCTKYLLEMLTENGHADVAYKIVAQETYPGWGYMLANGATTLWERWENATGNQMNSHNHPMMGSVDSWFYKYILGIRPNLLGAGFGKFSIRPYIISDLDFAEGEFNCPKGIIKSAWKKSANTITLHITIPENSVATVFVPTKNAESITESGKSIRQIRAIKFLRTEYQSAVFEVGSGSYSFKSDW
jgi:alpha-L-rhamnosidase